MNFFSYIILITSAALIPVLCRKHELVLDDDIRKYFSITTFGFFSNGQLEIHLNYLTFLKKYEGVFGLTLTKTVSDSITPYMESHQNKCLLVDDTLTNDGNIELISFVLNPNSNEVQVNCSRLSAFLDIQPSFDVNGSTVETPKKSKSGALKNNHSPSNSSKRKRSAEDLPANDPESAVMPDVPPAPVITSTKPTKQSPKSEVTSDQSAHAIVSEIPISEKKETTKSDETSISKICTASKLTYKKKIIFEKWKQLYDLKFIVYIKNINAEGLYSLYFHNCAGMKETSVPVNLSISIVEKNGESYLSAGEIPLPRLYFLMSVVFFVAGCIWISILRRKKEEVFKIHYLMGLLVFVKSLSLTFHGINFHIIGKDGEPMEAWAVLYYITHLLKGALLFITIVLIGTGWAFIKHILSDKDKKIFMIVIPLQVLANVAKIIMEESEEGESQHYTWREVFILVDLVCCGAILFPVVWSIRHLQEASHIDGKAAINLEKLKLFRRFYIMIVCYIYFTRIIVYLLKITVPFQYEWLDEMFRETATLIFFILTGYNFRPTTSNPYFRLSQDDDLEMDVVLTQTGFTEQATKTVRSRDIGRGEQTTPTKRESSHEYD